MASRVCTIICLQLFSSWLRGHWFISVNINVLWELHLIVNSFYSRDSQLTHQLIICLGRGNFRNGIEKPWCLIKSLATTCGDRVLTPWGFNTLPT